MADSQSQDAAAKQRILSHMNADHHDSVCRYLEHFCSVSSFKARAARLADISLESMTIAAAGKHHTIPLNPPMKSWREARERLVKLDKDALEGLGRSDVTVKRYTRPRGLHALVFAVCILSFILVSRRANALPGSYIYDKVLSYAPAFAAFTATVQPVVLWGMVVGHLIESVVLARKLEKYNVPVLSGLWWQWITSCFIEGFGALQRVEALAREERLAKEKAKH
ncbi:hypothetical protein IWX90DRAFT_485010 [Phyllosticta citrichinensis]|uniref:DUF2470 domain-containing protein n=1 Tax=Phyllosticta citrichinensis TaxID=1130410 RepID=A0ABR1Y0P9_9PEZI